MKTRKFLPPSIFFAVTIIAFIAASFAFCYMTEPSIREGEFPFSITYEYKGETKTFSGIFKATYSGSETLWTEHQRYWDGESVIDNPVDPEYPQVIDQNDELMTTLAIQANMHAGYFMGDPLHSDSYNDYGLEGPEPYVEYYDYINEIYLDEYNREEVLDSIGFKIIDFSYGEPVKNNSFSLSGIMYRADNASIFNLIALVFFILCILFVRKDKNYTYSNLDIASRIANFVVGFAVIPFITLICVFWDLNGGGTDIFSQIAYNIPFVAICCLAWSVVLRRKGFSKSGFAVQFGGVALFVLLMVLATIITY